MKPASQHNDYLLFHLIDQTVFPVNPPRPATGQLKPQRFRFSLSFKRGAPDLFKKGEDAVGLAFIRLQPITEIVQGCRRKGDIHSPRASSEVRLPERASSSDC